MENADLVGRTAEVTVGPLDDGLPGRVKLRDAHGNWHFPRARAFWIREPARPRACLPPPDFRI